MSAVLPFPSIAAREAAAVRQAIRLRGQHCGASTEAIAQAAHAAVAALLRERCSSGWAVHIGCRALRKRPTMRGEATETTTSETPMYVGARGVLSLAPMQQGLLDLSGVHAKGEA